MPWPRGKRSKDDPTLVHWRIHWRQGGRQVSVGAGTSKVPIGVDPADRIPDTVKRVWVRIEDQLVRQPFGIVVPDKDMTLERFVLEKWLPRRRSKPIKTQWYEGWVHPETGKRRGVLFTRVLPALGRAPIASITAEQIETFLFGLTETTSTRTGAPLKTVSRRTLNILRKLFNDAKRLGYYSGDNPCAGAGRELPDYKPEWWVPSLEALCQLIAEIPPEWRILPLLAVGSSLGFGEIAALDWNHVHFDRVQTLDRTQLGKLHIEHQVATGTREKGQLKTKARERWGDLLWPVRQALLDLPQRTTVPAGLVVAGVHGGHLSHNWWYRAVWQPACKRAGLEGLHFHSLRHGFASLMAAWGLLGEFPLYVAAQMGHADANTTNRVYAKLMREGVRLDKEETLRRLYAAYRGELVTAVSVLPRDAARPTTEETRA